MSTLAEDFAAVLTDIGRTPDSNDDPMRYSKRRAKQEALNVLVDAVATARRLIDLPGLIEADFKEAVKS